ncbi:glycosyltransferase [Pseudomonas matsuisoli]|uniref:Glycosyl transferase n=1 Tax=Pseudomonas matsuisoli TaxID=1515666 RepID=A0A917PU57_9PSED|nr:glycosyltransferase [Pseudomonas matsuisoli]GGJ91752.1 glycosyl transferase [Pseudomonas matsuisoli]
MIGVVIPAHNEEACLDSCLRTVLAAADHPGLRAEPVRVMVVLDACTDRSRAVVERFPIVECIEIGARNVGTARATGANLLIESGARWIACTDADTRVPADWLAAQLSCDADAVCGVVEVDDWSLHSLEVRSRYEAAYTDCDGHRHIHGANLGIASHAYLRAGGFPALTAHEDVHLVRRLEALDARIAWSRAVRVQTSSRLDCRAREGFGDYLRSLGVTA